MKRYLRRLIRAILAKPLSDAERIDEQDGITARACALSDALTAACGYPIRVAWESHGDWIAIFKTGCPFAVVTQMDIDMLSSKRTPIALEEAFKAAEVLGHHTLVYRPESRGVIRHG